MKQTQKRVFSLLLASLTLLLTLSSALLLTSCGDTGTVESTTASAETTPPTEPAETEPSFPEANYGDSDFVILGRGEKEASYPGFYICAEQVSDSMEEAVYRRNAATEDKYGVKISMVQESNPNEKIAAYLQSGDLKFDLILDRRSKLSTLAQTNCLYDYNKLGFDFSTGWWDSHCAEGYTVAGKLFFMANDVSVSNLAGVRFFYFNKKLITDYQLTSPYEYVEKDEWTLDNFLTMVKSVSTDNGDNVWDGNDTYGLLCETGSSNSNVMHLLVGCGIKFVEKNEDGTLVSNAGSEKTGEILIKIAEVLNNTPYVLTYDKAATGADTSSFGNNYNYGRSLFAADHFLFVQNGMGVADQFKEMVSDYGVAPNPKYNSEQEEYYHKMDRYSLIWAIPNSSSVDYDRLVNVFDYWAYQSSKTVMPAYYEVTIKTKRVQESTASAMLDLVKNSIRYDLTEPFAVNVADALYSAYTSGNLASSWKVSQKTIENAMTRLYDTIKALE